MKPKPKVSVLMTAYNTETYIAEAIESVLGQTFSDLELIIIDDGSSDKTLEIIKSYDDPRIRLIARENRGRVNSLNEGVNMAEGELLAIMDSDDVAQPKRLEKQVRYLDTHPECSVVTSTIKLIDGHGEFLPDWEEDKANITPEQIKGLMPYENCIANPTATGKTILFKKFGYNINQISEDYDLWLRILSAGYSIHKINEPLLHYRIRSDSITQLSNSLSVPKKNLTFKYRYLLNQIKAGRFGRIEAKVLWSFLQLLVPMLIRKIIYILKRPFPSLTPLGRMVLKPKRKILFIVPWMTVGGADRVFLDVVRALHSKKCTVYCVSTVPSPNEWLPLFKKYCKEVVNATNDVREQDIAQFLVDYVSKNQIDTIVTSNTVAGYIALDGIKQVRPAAKIYDIIHGQGGKAEGGGMPLHSTPFDKYIDKRIVVTKYMRDYLVKKFSIDPGKIVVIHNGAHFSRKYSHKVPREIKMVKGKFIVLWAGRFHVEKHPELAIEAARLVAKEINNIHFILAGSGYMKPELEDLIKKYSLESTVTITQQPYDDPMPYMVNSDLLLMTSEMEGMPIVILEAYSAKLPVIATKVGGIPEIVVNKESGYLINYNPTFAKKAAEKIIFLSKNKKIARKYGTKGYNKVKTEFSVLNMTDQYAEVLGL